MPHDALSSLGHMSFGGSALMQKSVLRLVIVICIISFVASVASFAAEVPSDFDVRIVERLEQYLYEKPQTGELSARLAKFGN